MYGSRWGKVEGREASGFVLPVMSRREKSCSPVPVGVSWTIFSALTSSQLFGKYKS
jgi:hypothetical protein